MVSSDQLGMKDKNEKFPGEEAFWGRIVPFRLLGPLRLGDRDSRAPEVSEGHLAGAEERATAGKHPAAKEPEKATSPLVRGLAVVETGVDPVTLRFSGVCSAD